MHLEEVILPSTIRIIHRQAFCQCMSLKFIDIPSGLREIYDNVFWDTGLVNLVLPKSTLFLGQGNVGNVPVYYKD